MHRTSGTLRQLFWPALPQRNRAPSPEDGGREAIAGHKHPELSQGRRGEAPAPSPGLQGSEEYNEPGKAAGGFTHKLITFLFLPQKRLRKEPATLIHFYVLQGQRFYREYHIRKHPLEYISSSSAGGRFSTGAELVTTAQQETGACRSL